MIRKEAELGQLPGRHLRPDEFHSLVEDAASIPPEHLAACELCRGKLESYRRAESLLAEASPGIAPAASGCPPAGVWFGVPSGELSPKHTDELLAHVARCGLCSARLAAVLREEEPVSAEEAALIAALPSSGTAWQRRMAGRLTASPRPAPRPLAWLAAAAVVLMAVGIWWFHQRSVSPEVLLAQAYTESRPMEFRLNDKGYRAVEQNKGSAGAGYAALPPSLKKALPLIDQGLAAHNDDPDLLRYQAEAGLLQPLVSPDVPLATLERLRRQNPADTRIWLPLACAYFRRAESEPGNAAADYARALELVDSVVQKSPHDLPALFDAALIRTRLHDSGGAIAAWERYLKEDSASDYAAEARRNLRDLRQRKQARDRVLELRNQGPAAFLAHTAPVPAELFLDVALSEWLPRARADPASRIGLDREAVDKLAQLLTAQTGDPFLTDLVRGPVPQDAAAALAEAIRLDRSGNPGEGARQARRAAQLFGSAGNTAGQLRARAELVYGLHRAADGKDCLAEATALEPVASRYAWISAQNLIEKSICLAYTGEEAEAMKVMEAAQKRAAAARLDALDLRAFNMLTNSLVRIGNVNAVWRRAPEALERYWSVPMAPNQGHQIYGDLSEAANRLSLPHVSYDFRQESVEAISQTSEALIQATNRNLLSISARSAGYDDAADREKQLSRHLFEGLPDTPLKRNIRIDADLSSAEQDIRQGRAAQSAIPLLLRLRAEPEPTATALPRVLEALASAQWLTGDFEAARRTAREAAARNHVLMASLPSPADRLAAARRKAQAYRMLAEIRLSKENDPPGAFAALQTLSDPPDPAKMVAAWSKALGNDVFLELSDLPGGPVVWRLDSSGLSYSRIGGKPAPIAEQAEALLRKCSDSRSDRAEIELSAAALQNELLGSLARGILETAREDRVLIVAADGPFARLPFNLLFGPAPRALVRSAGLSEYLDRAGPDTIDTKRSQLLLADSPEVPDELRRLYPPLGEALQEADDVAGQFTRVRRLEGKAATVSAVSAALPSADVFHFSGHGSADGGNGALILSGEDPAHPFSAFFTAEQLSRARGRCQLAVLSACGTATGEAEGPVNPDSLVRALLQSGVRRVVASQWSVPAGATRRIMSAFYRRIGEGAEPARALQLAEADLRGEPSTSHPFYWAAFQIFGYR